MKFTDESRASDLQRALHQQQREGRLCDVTIHVADHSLPAHRCVVAASSDYFQILSNGHFADSKSRDYTIPNGDAEAAKRVLDFMYSGEIDIDNDNVEDVLKIADFLCIKTIKSYCSALLRTHLTEETCLRMRLLTELYDLTDIAVEVTRYMSPRFGDLIQTRELLDYPLDYITSLLRDPKLNYIQEETILYFVLKWVEHDRDERSLHLTSLLEHVEMSYLPERVLRRQVLGSKRVMSALSPPRTEALRSLVADSAAAQRRVDDVIVCRSRARTQNGPVKILFYYVADDRWMELDSEPEPGCWSHLESLVAEQNVIYFLTSQPEDLRGYAHPAPRNRKLWKLELPSGGAGDVTWSAGPCLPSSLGPQARLVPHIRGIFILDRNGLVEKLDQVSNTWVNYGDPLFLDNANSTTYFLPMPMDKYIFLLRAYNSGYSFEYSECSYSLHRYDTSRYTWEALSDVEASDLDIGCEERFHGYTVTPYAILLKNELGLPRAQYSFLTRQWSPAGVTVAMPEYVKEVWGSASRGDKVYLAGSMAQGVPTFLMFDHGRGRFKAVTPPSEYLTGLLYSLVVPRALRDSLKEHSGMG